MRSYDDYENHEGMYSLVFPLIPNLIHTKMHGAKSTTIYRVLYNYVEVIKITLSHDHHSHDYYSYEHHSKKPKVEIQIDRAAITTALDREVLKSTSTTKSTLRLPIGFDLPGEKGLSYFKQLGFDLETLEQAPPPSPPKPIPDSSFHAAVLSPPPLAAKLPSFQAKNPSSASTGKIQTDIKSMFALSATKEKPSPLAPKRKNQSRIETWLDRPLAAKKEEGRKGEEVIDLTEEEAPPSKSKRARTSGS